LIANLVAAALIAGSPGPAPQPDATTTAVQPQVTVLAIFKALPVTKESHASSYARERFGGWIDADGDCHDTRAEVLAAESTTPVTYSSAGCVVSTGQWLSWYDGATWTRASDVDIDHMVPLAEAWRSGAWQYPPAVRRAYANDLDYGPPLVAVTDNVNQAKSDGDPAEWLPEKKQCRYVTHYIATKYRWKLTIDSAESKALRRVLSGKCGAATMARPPRGL
jgi:hypothetical protein